MTKPCEQCGNSVDLLKPGRVPRFCSTKCRVAANRPAIPVELRKLDRWVRWSPTKVPLRLDGSAASSTDPESWSSFAQVRAHRRKGFVLGEGIGCFDLDHCLSGSTLSRPAQAFLDNTPATYVEVSPSGTGLHVWGLLPEGPGTRRKVGSLAIERYSRSRYITVTGRRWPGSVSRLADLSEVRL
jgi:primase-polymerase (primpol)-like protein